LSRGDATTVSPSARAGRRGALPTLLAEATRITVFAGLLGIAGLDSPAERPLSHREDL
jgi:hypothetical protein